jgi:hypothetical protein
VTETVAPVRRTRWASGATVKVQPVAAAWETPRDCPAIVSVVLRATAPVFAPTLKVTVPLPLPADPPVIATQLAPDVAVHAQPAAALTVNELDPAAAATERLAGDTV